MLLNIIAWIIVGGIAGWLAGVLMGGTGLSTIATIVLGIIGAVVGGFLMQLVLGRDMTGDAFSIEALVVSVIGAIVVIAIARLFVGSRTRA